VIKIKKEIDLKKYQIRTDLAIEEVKKNSKDISIKTKQIENIKVTMVKILNEVKEINKRKGTYITIEFDDVTDYTNNKKVETAFIDELTKMLKTKKIKKDDYGIIIGLGNKLSTPDSIGPYVIENIIVTNHIYQLGLLEDGFRRVSAIAPGVKGQTGMETFNIIKSVVETEKPSFLIIIDSLASSSLDHVNKTIQITDTGIAPGSGIGNKTEEITEEKLNIPVIAIGVPTVVDAATIVNDTINYMYKHFAYNKQNYNNPVNKLIINPNYLNTNAKITDEEKKTLLGIIGTLSNEETKQLIFEILSPIGYNLMVTPKEIDFQIKKISELLSSGINNVLNENVTNL